MGGGGRLGSGVHVIVARSFQGDDSRPLPPLPTSRSFLVTNTDYSFIGINTQRLALVVAILMSALGGILLTALLHGEILSVLGSGFQYWIMQPVFLNMLQVRLLLAHLLSLEGHEGCAWCWRDGSSLPAPKPEPDGTNCIPACRNR